MKILKISYFSTVGGQTNKFETTANYYFLSPTKARIKFNVKTADFSTEYALSKLDDSIMLVSKGDTEYSFCLQKNSRTKSLIKTAVGILDCEITTKMLNACFTENSFSIEISYTVKVSGNKMNSKLVLRSI